MRVLSLFDGMSCGRVALERVGITPSVYFASEIDKYAIAVGQDNHPSNVQLGDVRNVASLARVGALGSIDLLIGGSPCQGFSKAGKNLGFNDPRSRLLFEFVSIKNALNPRWFLLENVGMKSSDANFVSALLGVQPVQIDSALFSAQTRKRTYWTNIPIAPIVDRNIKFWQIRDYAENAENDQFMLNATPSRIRMWSNGSNIDHNRGNGVCRNISFAEKTGTLTTKQDRCPNAGLVKYRNFARYLTHSECELLQTLPIGYTKSTRDFQRYVMLGNGWTVDVIAHIFKGML